jgi:excisionase family DNA binding protein
VSPQHMERLLSPGEAAMLLNCSTRTIRRMIRHGRLPCWRLNSRVLRIPASALNNLAKCPQVGTSPSCHGSVDTH